MSDKYCVNCKWFVYVSEFGPNHRCTHHRFGVNLVTGMVTGRSCATEREQTLNSQWRLDSDAPLCGRQAIYFEPKEDAA